LGSSHLDISTSTTVNPIKPGLFEPATTMALKDDDNVMTTEQLRENASTDDDEFGEFHDSSVMDSSSKEVPEFSLSHSVGGTNNNTTGISADIEPTDSNDDDAFGDFHDSSMDVTHQIHQTEYLSKTICQIT